MNSTTADLALQILQALGGNMSEVSNKYVSTTNDILEAVKNRLANFIAPTTIPFFQSELLPYDARSLVSMSQGNEPPIILVENPQMSSYQWNRIGNLVTLFLRLHYNVAGVAVTELVASLPIDMPIPASAIVNVDGSPIDENSMSQSSILSVGNCNCGDTTSLVNRGYVYVTNAGVRENCIRINHTTQNNKHYQIVIQYFTNNH